MIPALDEAFAAADSGEPTPRRLFLAGTARDRVSRVAEQCARLTSATLRLVPAYSLKTNPREELLRAALQHGFFAETISNAERAWAARNGFTADATIANGPEPIEADAPPAFAFADSVEAFARNAHAGLAQVCGVRLRPSMTRSRFGVPVGEHDRLRDALRALPPRTRIAFSFHVRREDLHGAPWRAAAGDVLERAATLAGAAGLETVAFDVGGGWTPEEYERDFASDLRWVLDRTAVEMPACRTVIVEPGQALCTPLEALVTRVLEVRARDGAREAIVDAAYADWPQMHTFPHPMYARRRGHWERLGYGPDRIGGRTCLEYDAVEGVRFPADLAAGDLLTIGDVGAYDHSMAFTFALGEPAGARTS